MSTGYTLSLVVYALFNGQNKHARKSGSDGNGASWVSSGCYQACAGLLPWYPAPTLPQLPLSTLPMKAVFGHLDAALHDLKTFEHLEQVTTEQREPIAA